MQSTANPSINLSVVDHAIVAWKTFLIVDVQNSTSSIFMIIHELDKIKFQATTKMSLRIKR